MPHRTTNESRGFTLIELMVVVAIIGILAAVAIPAFMRYFGKAKSAEALTNLEKIYSGARTYFLENNQFPRSAPSITPTIGTCCSGGSDKCAPNASLWTDETWIALQFSMDDPHYYMYQYTSSSSTSNFYARAFGDVDCDGIYSTFQMYGEINSQYADGPSGTAAVFRKNAAE